MLEEKLGSLFQSNAQTLVNTVNCEGFMGKGLALEMKRRFPEVDRPYRDACENGSLAPGILQLIPGSLRWIVNFPTKDRWRAKSKLSYVEQGLEYFRSHYKHWGITSVAFPQLGCGLGGLAWEDVRPLMEEYLADLDIPVEVWISTSEKAQSPSVSRHRSKRNARRPVVQQRLL